MRHKNYVKQINEKDINMLHAFRCCNHLSREQLLGLVSANRMNSFIKQGVITLVHSIQEGKTTTAFSITRKGRRWAASHIPELRDYSWYSSATAVEHNIQLAERYLELVRECSPSQMLTENDMRQYLMRVIEEREDRYQLLEDLREARLSPPDMGYVRDGEIGCVEIVTTNYSQADIEAKAAFTEVTGIPIEFVKN